MIFSLLRVLRAVGNNNLRVRACGGINILRLPGFSSLTGMAVLSFIRALTVLAVVGGSGVCAQPSPEVQRRITAAIEAAANASSVDYTAFVNPFIGTGM